MAISFLCDCGFKIRAPDTSGGKRGRCPQCKQPVVVPMPKTTPAVARQLVEAPRHEEPLHDAPSHDENAYDLADAVPTAAHTPAYRSASGRPSLAGQSTVMASPVEPPHPSAAAMGTSELSATPVAAPAAAWEATTGGASVGIRRHLYWILLLVLIPLAWSTLHHAPEENNNIEDRLQQTIEHHPEVEERLASLSKKSTLRDLCDLLPDDRLEGALLAERTQLHWAFAAASGVVFLAAALLLFPAGHAKIGHLAGIGLLTGTLGIVLLLAFQWLAFHMPLFRGRGAITLLLDLVWLIGQSYRMALGDHGFWLSFLGFTAGVGFCEEACKALPLLFKARTSGFSSWRSALLWGLISGIGFGVSEGVTYSSDYYNGISGADMYLVRFISCVGLHGIWAAAVAITIFRRQEHFRHAQGIFEWLLETLKAVIVPMVLHGLYDTLLKQEYEVWALAVAVVSFGWLAYQIEAATRHFGEPDRVLATA